MTNAAARLSDCLVSVASRLGVDIDPATLRLRALEWSGCGLGLAGAFLLATNTSVSRYGWIAFLAANFAVIAFARTIRAHGLLVQQCGFMLTSLLGIYRAFWPHL